MEINLSLLARLHALDAAFNRDGFRDAIFAAPKKAATSLKNNSSLKDLVKEDEEGDGGKGGEGGEGGGTMKGHRGKNDLYAKAVNAARRLGR